MVLGTCQVLHVFLTPRAVFLRHGYGDLMLSGFSRRFLFALRPEIRPTRRKRGLGLEAIAQKPAEMVPAKQQTRGTRPGCKAPATGRKRWLGGSLASRHHSPGLPGAYFCWTLQAACSSLCPIPTRPGRACGTLARDMLARLVAEINGYF